MLHSKQYIPTTFVSKTMKLLLSYLKKYKKIVFLALTLAAVNQSFSLMDPLIAGMMMDRFGVHISDYQNDPSK